MKINVFELTLPTDGTHQELVDEARAAGVPFDKDRADKVVEMCVLSSGQITPSLVYALDVSDDVKKDLPRVSRRLEACARLVKAGFGEMPWVDMPKLKRLRDLLQETATAIKEFLEAGTISE